MLGKMPLSVIEADVNFNKNKTTKTQDNRWMNRLEKKNPSLHNGIIRTWENICDTMLYDKKDNYKYDIM